MEKFNYTKATTILRAAMSGIPIKYGKYEYMFSADMKVFGPIAEFPDGAVFVSAMSDVSLAQFVEMVKKMPEDDFENIIDALGATEE